jgi:hypothetical protein
MTRLEYKYYFPMDYLDELRRDIMPFLEYDHYSGLIQKKEYTVRSIYLDSPGMLTYREKDAGLMYRNKYRIRGYNLLSKDSVVFLEIKRKENDFVSKNRAPLFYGDLERFIGTRDFSLILNSKEMEERKADARKFMYYFLLYNLKPAVIVAYEREAFECKYNSGLRITFDKNVRTRITNSYNNLYDDINMMPTFENHFVLEIKFHKIIPFWLPAVLKKYNTSRESVSKYATSIDISSSNKFNHYINGGIGL